LPNGEQRVCNICKPTKSHDLVELYENPADYIVGTGGNGGMNAVAMCSVRIENMDPNDLWAMHYFFRTVSYRFMADTSKEGRARWFQLSGARTGLTKGGAIWNYIVSFLSCGERTLAKQQSGNCARWTSRGLEVARLVTRPRIWPKALWADLFEKYLEDPDNVNVVYYRQLRSAQEKRASKCLANSFVHPLKPLPSMVYWGMEQYADVVVSTEFQTQEDGVVREELHLEKGQARRHSALFYCLFKSQGIVFKWLFCLFFVLWSVIFYWAGEYSLMFCQDHFFGLFDKSKYNDETNENCLVSNGWMDFNMRLAYVLMLNLVWWVAY